MSTSTSGRQRLATLVAVCALAALPAAAGTMTLSWSPSTDSMTVGYDVEILDEAGQILRVIDAESSTTVTVDELTDGTVHRFRVRPYDASGARARRASAALTTMPSPRIESLAGTIIAGERGEVSVFGANFDQDARFVSKRKGVIVRQATIASHDLAVLVLDWDGTGAPVSIADLLAINPVRKNERYFNHNPVVLDVDGSGAIDDADERLVRDAFGAKRGEPTYRAALDVNGDGVIGGEDAAPIRARLDGTAPSGQ